MSFFGWFLVFIIIILIIIVALLSLSTHWEHFNGKSGEGKQKYQIVGKDKYGSWTVNPNNQTTAESLADANGANLYYYDSTDAIVYLFFVTTDDQTAKNIFFTPSTTNTDFTGVKVKNSLQYILSKVSLTSPPIYTLNYSGLPTPYV